MNALAALGTKNSISISAGKSKAPMRSIAIGAGIDNDPFNCFGQILALAWPLLAIGY